MTPATSVQDPPDSTSVGSDDENATDPLGADFVRVSVSATVKVTVSVSPTSTEGALKEAEVEVVRLFTVCITGGVEVLALKSVVAPYVAVNVRLPSLAKVMLQLPAPPLSVPEQLSSVLAFTVTLPVGVPEPGAFTDTWNAMVTDSPTNEGLKVCESITVVVAAGFTVRLVLPLLISCAPEPE